MAKGRVLKIKKDVPATWEEALQGFLYWKQAQNLAERTLKDYRNHVSQLFHRHPEAFNPEKQRTEVFEYMAQPVKPATFNLRLIYLKAFFDWCIQEGIFTENPLSASNVKKWRAVLSISRRIF